MWFHVLCWMIEDGTCPIRPRHAAPDTCSAATPEGAKFSLERLRDSMSSSWALARRVTFSCHSSVAVSHRCMRAVPGENILK